MRTHPKYNEHRRETQNVKQCYKCGRLYPNDPEHFHCTKGGSKNTVGNTYIGHQCNECYKNMANEQARKHRNKGVIANRRRRNAKRLALDLSISYEAAHAYACHGCQICGNDTNLHGFRLRGVSMTVICEDCYLKPLKEYLVYTHKHKKLYAAMREH